MKLLYITQGIGPVFQSQVVELLNKLEKRKLFSEIYLMVGLRNSNDIEKVYSLNNNIKLKIFKTYPEYPFFDFLTENAIQKSFKDIGINEKYILHVRSELFGMLAYNAYFKMYSKKPNILIDIRGSVIEEIKLYGKMNSIFKYLKLSGYASNVQKVLSNVNYINTVSNELKNYIKVRYEIRPDCIYTIPTIAGETFTYDKKIRQKIRKLLNIGDNEILFVFSSGSSQAWQNDDEIVDSLTSKGYKILMLTKKHYDDPNIISKFVPYNEVPNYLNAADIGIIIRNDDIVNNVASPIKFSEYIACGLPVISTRAVNIITDILIDNNCGSLLNLFKINDTEIDDLISLDREHISEIGMKYFSVNKITDKYIEVYKNMVVTSGQ